MARTAARSGKGTTLSYSDTSGGSYTAVGELVSVGQPEVTAGTTEATHYASDSSTIEKISTGWKDASDVPFTINYVKARFATLRGLVGTEKYFKVTYPDASTDLFLGSITAFGGGEVPNKDTMRSAGRITVLGTVTFTAGA